MKTDFTTITDEMFKGIIYEDNKEVIFSFHEDHHQIHEDIELMVMHGTIRLLCFKGYLGFEIGAKYLNESYRKILSFIRDRRLFENAIAIEIRESLESTINMTFSTYREFQQYINLNF